MTTADALATFSAVQAQLAEAACMLLDLAADQGDDMATTITTRDQYRALFTSPLEALDWENSCLSIEGKHLPPAARAVLEDSSAEPAPEYWQWLADQLAKA